MGDSPDGRPRPTADDLRRVLADHRAWVETQGRDGKRANLSGCDLRGANLEGACLVAAKLLDADLAGARLLGADLTGAYLSAANLSGAVLNLANLSAARLSDADLSGAELRRADLSGAYLERANLANADLDHANLTGAELVAANLSGARLAGANLTRAELQRANLAGADFERAVLTGAALQLADLTGADLAEADLSRARLARATLARADLYHADLSGAHLNGADLSHARLRGARLENADLRYARVHRLDQSFVRGAQFSAMSSRWWAFLCGVVFQPLSGWLGHRGYGRAAGRVGGLHVEHNDPWSVLRQSYAGPRVLFLFFTVVVFALPYVGKAAVYSSFGQVERRVADQAEARRRSLERRLAERPDDRLAREEYDRLGDALTQVDRRPVWEVLLDRDKGKVYPSVLAGLLVLYNLGLYVLITNVSALRDEEERSGWTPAWTEYRHLLWVHRVAVVLFYVSCVSFALNMAEILSEEVLVLKTPAAGGSPGSPT